MKRGFTLVELLVVLGIIGILAAALVPAIQKARGHGRSGHTSSKVYSRPQSTPKELESMQYEGHNLIHDPACKCNQR